MNFLSLSLLCVSFLGLCFSANSNASILYDNTTYRSDNSTSTAIGDTAVTDSFTLSSTSTITSLTFDLWQGSVSNSNINLEVSFSTDQLDTPLNTIHNYINTATRISPQTIFGPNYISTFSFNINNLTLNAGTYYLTLENASDPGSNSPGGAPWWDVSYGSSTGYFQNLSSCALFCSGSIPSETFQILGSTKVSTVPVPAAVWLFGSTLAGFGFINRRRTAIALL